MIRRLLPVLAVGALLAPVTAHADDDHTVTGDCAFHFSGLPNSNQAVLVVVGHAEATGHLRPVSTGLRCVVTISGTDYPFAMAAPGPVVAVAGQSVVTIGPTTICAYPEALWSDNHYLAPPPVCH